MGNLDSELRVQYHSSFFDELAKIAEAKYRLSVGAHELGHAKDFEQSRAPGLRKALDIAVPLAGLGGVAYGQVTGNPVAATLGAAATAIPTLVREGTASYHAMKAMRQTGKFTDEDLKKARGQLLRAGGTYLASAIGLIGSAAAASSNNPKVVGAASVPMALGGLSALGLGASMVAGLEGSPKVSKEDLEALRAGMNVKAKIYDTKPQPGLGGRWHELSAAYVPAIKNKLISAIAEADVGSRAKTKNIHELRQLLREGGVLLPRATI